MFLFSFVCFLVCLFVCSFVFCLCVCLFVCAFVSSEEFARKRWRGTAMSRKRIGQAKKEVQSQKNHARAAEGREQTSCLASIVLRRKHRISGSAADLELQREDFRQEGRRTG